MAFTQDDCRRFSELVRQRHESAFVILRALGLISVLCYFLHFVSYWRLTPELRVVPTRTKKKPLAWSTNSSGIQGMPATTLWDGPGRWGRSVWEGDRLARKDKTCGIKFGTHLRRYQVRPLNNKPTRTTLDPCAAAGCNACGAYQS